jgi:hypothetical protein
MSDLNLGPSQQSSPLKGILIAVVVLAAVAVGVFYLGPHRTAEITIPKTHLYAAHTTSKSLPGAPHIVGQLAESENDLYVVATLNIKNNLPIPIYLDNVTATYTSPEDTVLDARAPSATDLSRLEEIFPALSPLMPTPLPLSEGIPAKSTVQGTVLLHFPGLTEQTWKEHKSITLTLNYIHQSPQTIPIP